MRTFLSSVTNPSIECRVYSLSSCIQNYKEFYTWMYKNCTKDKKDVIEKKLEPLEECYDELLMKIQYRKTDKNVDVKLMSFSKNNEKIFEKYLNSNKIEYFLFDKNQNKKYKYYNNLFSWYDLCIEGSDEVIDNLYKVSKKDKSMQKYNNYFEIQSKFDNNEKISLVGDY